MQAKIETLKAKNSNDEEYLVYPRTLIKCVTNEHGDNLEELIQNTVLDAEGTVYVDYGSHEETTDYVPIDADMLGGETATQWDAKIATTNTAIAALQNDFVSVQTTVSAIVVGTTPVAKAIDADTLDGHDSSHFATAEDLEQLRTDVESSNEVPEGATYIDLEGAESTTETIYNDADSLGGESAAEWDAKISATNTAVAMNTENITSIQSSVTAIVAGTTTVGKAADAETLQGYNPSSFVPMTGATMGGQLVANADAVADLETSQVRNISVGTVDMVDGETELAPGALYGFCQTLVTEEATEEETTE